MADISQIVLKDAEGNVLGTYDIKDANVPHTSETAESGGTTLSLVTTGEKATWNAKSDLQLGTTSTTALQGDTKYAGSSSAGGAATSAEKLTNTAKIGTLTNPVYFTASGVPEACTYSLEKSVPSDAVFTDTNNAVTQTATSDDKNYEVLFSGTNDNTTRTEGARKSNTLTIDPSTSTFRLCDTAGTQVVGMGKVVSSNATHGGFIKILNASGKEVVNGTTVSNAGRWYVRDSNGTAKVTLNGTNGDVSASTFNSKSISESNTASTIVARNSSSYVYATYYNASCGNDNGATSSSYALYANSDNWIRKCSMGKMYSALGGSGCVQLYTGTLGANSQTTVNYGSYSAYVIICRVDGSAYYYPVVVPKGYITTSAGTEITTLDQYNWMTIQMWYSGSNCYCKCANGTNGNRAIMKIYGLY